MQGDAGARFIQFLSASVVIALSSWLYWRVEKQLDECAAADYRCASGRFPPSLIYSIFAGAFGMLDFAVGALNMWFDVHVLMVVAFDVLAACFYVAGGINLIVLYHTQDDIRDTKFEIDTGFQFIGGIVSLLTACLIGNWARMDRKRARPAMYVRGG
ncbi:unnamed protein product [Zymoseptoria tritici ST99CH_3D7]|uniref:MARVEL domain-containing protein n=1 Tax=Zymoseptoria tritici (strain ST99CH_3D7) TaxID=1276538 RepID=A0A1X7S0K3_ZYMT9|nr:unnamed protein product [Zymoseptoria tritici ST99CH_3D7]